MKIWMGEAEGSTITMHFVLLGPWHKSKLLQFVPKSSLSSSSHFWTILCFLVFRFHSGAVFHLLSMSIRYIHPEFCPVFLVLLFSPASMALTWILLGCTSCHLSLLPLFLIIPSTLLFTHLISVMGFPQSSSFLWVGWVSPLSYGGGGRESQVPCPDCLTAAISNKPSSAGTWLLSFSAVGECS